MTYSSYKQAWLVQSGAGFRTNSRKRKKQDLNRWCRDRGGQSIRAIEQALDAGQYKPVGNGLPNWHNDTKAELNTLLRDAPTTVRIFPNGKSGA